MLAVLSPSLQEGRLQSDRLREAGIPHELFGFHPTDFYGHNEGRGDGEGRYNRTRLINHHGEVTPGLLTELRQRGFDSVANAGTLNAIVFALGRGRPAADGNGEHVLVQRSEMLTLEDMLTYSGITCRTLTEVFDGIAFEGPPPSPWRLGPDAGFAEKDLSHGIDVSEIHEAVALAQEAISAQIDARRHIEPWLERVALTAIYDSGVIKGVQWGTDTFLDQMSMRPRGAGNRLMIKLTGAGQAKLDPSAIGSPTIKHARKAHVDAIILSTEGMIFHREDTLEYARRHEIPIYGF